MCHGRGLGGRTCTAQTRQIVFTVVPSFLDAKMIISNPVSPTRSGFPDSGPDPDFLRVCSPEKVWFLFKSPDLNKILTLNALNSQWTVGMMSLTLGSVDASTNPKI